MRAMDKRIIANFNRLVSRSGYYRRANTSASRAYELVARRQASAHFNDHYRIQGATFVMLYGYSIKTIQRLSTRLKRWKIFYRQVMR